MCILERVSRVRIPHSPHKQRSVGYSRFGINIGTSMFEGIKQEKSLMLLKHFSELFVKGLQGELDS